MLSFFVIVPAYSRRIFVEFTQTMEHVLACQEHDCGVWPARAQYPIRTIRTPSPRNGSLALRTCNAQRISSTSQCQ